MKALSLWEPWATAIAVGLKRIETRGWGTAYRGPLAIHAARTTVHGAFILDPLVRDAFADAGIAKKEDLSFGCVVATCRLVGCVRTEDLVAGRVPGIIAEDFSSLERSLGNYDRGRFAWLLAEVVRLPKPVPARGAQGFWEWKEAGDV